MKSDSFKALFAVCLILGLATLTFGQQQFKVWAECSYGCDRPANHTLIHFEYGGGLQITVEAGYPAAVTVTKDNFQTATEFELNQNPTKYFVNKSDGKRVNAALGSVLLKVFSVGEYCDNNDITGNVSETGRYVPLAELRKYLKISSTTTVKKKAIPTKSKNAEISEKDLREQMMSDGLRSSLEGCEGMSVSIKQTKIDLNKDGQTEIIATAGSGCWGAQGTKTWIYQRTNGQLKALLSDADGGYIPTSTSTRGFRDITLSSGS